jgi:hypothetical protein
MSVRVKLIRKLGKFLSLLITFHSHVKYIYHINRSTPQIVGFLISELRVTKRFALLQLKAFYVDLLVPLETNLEKDTKVVQVSNIQVF